MSYSATALTEVGQIKNLAQIINQIIENKASFYDSEIAEISRTVVDILEAFTAIKEDLEQN